MRRLNETLRLQDGRALGYAEYGDASGVPLLYFHGLPGSRIQAAIFDGPGHRACVRVIAPERPGFGLSDFQRGRTILDWADDVVALSDALGLGRFAVAGVSSGGMYVSACGLRISERLTSAHIISGACPTSAPGATHGMNMGNKVMWTLSRRLPFVADAIWMVLTRMGRSRLERGMQAAKDALEKSPIEPPDNDALATLDNSEAVRYGWRGLAWDARLYARPWGFRLEDLRTPVVLWQGEADRNVPPSMGRHQARVIPQCEARYFPGEGHGLWVDHADEIVAIAKTVSQSGL